jgi:hypothetical protein
MDEALELLGSNRTISEPYAALTFDDGYRSLRAEALGQFRKYHFPATVFIARGHCCGTSDSASQPLSMRGRQMLKAAEICGNDIFDLPRIDAFYFDKIIRLGDPETVAGGSFVRAMRRLRPIRTLWRSDRTDS